MGTPILVILPYCNTVMQMEWCYSFLKDEDILIVQMFLAVQSLTDVIYFWICSFFVWNDPHFWFPTNKYSQVCIGSYRRSSASCLFFSICYASYCRIHIALLKISKTNREWETTQLPKGRNFCGNKFLR